MSVQNPQYITIGSADLFLNGRNVGSVKDTSFGISRDYIEHVTGIPQRVTKKVLLTDSANVKATLEEISPENLALALGLDNTDIESVVNGKDVSNWVEVIQFSRGWSPLLHSPVERATGKADSGTDTTLVDANLANTDDYYNGWILRIIDGTNAGEERIVTGYDASTHTITVDSAFTSAIDNTSVYVLTSFHAQIGTVVTEKAEVGATSVKVRSTAGFNAGDAIMIGTQSYTISSVSGNAIVLTSSLTAVADSGEVVRNTTVILQEDVDYRVDYNDGRVERLEGGAIPYDGAIAVKYEYTTFESQKIPIGKLTSSKTYHVELKHHFVDGGWLVIEFWKANVSSNFEFGFNTSDWVGMPLEINAVNDERNHPDAPYGTITILGE